MTITVGSFGKLPDGVETQLFTLTNGHGTVVKLTDYGALVAAVETPDREGRKANLTWGFDSAAGFAANTSYFGCTVGRYGNRIAGGRFKIGDQQYTLATNNGPNSLHGGVKGFNRYVWKAKTFQTATEVGVEFSHTSPDGDEGFPGQLDCTVAISLTAENELKFDYRATTDKPTVVNLTNHCYWNLGGVGSGTVLEHQLTVAADKYLAVDDTLIPTGELLAVKGTPFDFTEPHPIGARIGELKKDKLPNGPDGYDHCYALRGQDGKLAFAARVVDPKSGRVMEISTTEPGIQFYTGNHLSGAEADAKCPQHGGFCLETQHYPDSPNKPAFPSTLLKPGETYRTVTVHKFSVAK